ncbi:MAG TPA: hypothetical protein VER32_13685 [Pyrinomonadaceae bacterium]|nr:hypothetical protein [Pyrinomonadaceae bacterium]
MPNFPRTLLAALCLAAAGLNTPAQTPAPKQAKKSPAKTATATAAEVDPLAEIRRTTAISLVNSLADEARDFTSPVLRARVQARAADVLWESDRERALSLFRRAWDAAEAADDEQERREEEEKRRQEAERGYFAIRRGPNLRSEVVRLAAKRDRALGEEFLARMDEAAKEKLEREESALKNAERKPADAARSDPHEAPPAARQRLALARQLLQDGDAERALQFADPALTTTTMEAIEFLSRLRPHTPKAADERFAALVARAAQDPSSDANTVSLLSSYLFTPSMYITFQGTGANSNHFDSTLVAPPDAAPALRAAFFSSAAAILLRPTPPPDQDRTTTGRAGTYLVIARLLPLFEQHSPERAAALRQKLASLVPDTPEDARDPRRNSALTRGLVPEDTSRDRVQEALERLKTAKDSAERDAVYSDAVFNAVSRDDDSRAAELIDKIEDQDLRRQLRNFLDFQTLDEAVRRRKDVQEILRLARSGELTSVQRAWALTEAARLLAKAEPGRAIEVLDEAAAEARKIDAAAPERVRALIAVATQHAVLDRARMWELMSEIVKAANAAADFTGEDAYILVSLRTKFSSNTRSTSVESFNLASLFEASAREDLDRAVDLARGLKNEHPRAAATLAIARAVLRKPDGPARRADAR